MSGLKQIIQQCVKGFYLVIFQIKNHYKQTLGIKHDAHEFELKKSLSAFCMRHAIKVIDNNAKANQ